MHGRGELSPPGSEAIRRTDALPPDIGCEHQSKPIPPMPHGLVADIDTPLEQQVLDVSQAQGKVDIHQDRKPDDLGR